MGARDKVSCLGQHGGFVLTAQVDGVTQSHDVHAVVAHGQNGIQVGEQGRIRVVLAGLGVSVLAMLHQIGFGVHLDEVVDLWVIHGIARHQTTLSSHNADGALVGNLEQMLGVSVGRVDALTVEVCIQMLELLVAREQHQASRTARSFHVILDVDRAHFLRHIYRNLYLLGSDSRHFSSLEKHVVAFGAVKTPHLFAF